MCGCFPSADCSVNSGYGCHISLDTIENYLILRAVILTCIYGVSFATLPGQQLWLLGGHLDFPCTGAFFGAGAVFGGGSLPMWHFSPQCPILLHLEHLESHVGQFALPGGCCHVQLGQSLEGAGGGCVSVIIAAGVGSMMLVMADCINRFGAVGDLFPSVLNGKGVHCNVS